MASIITTARIVCKDEQARERVVGAFRKIIEYTTPNEPEVLQYVCAVPYYDDLKKEIYMIEEYANQAASDAHLTIKPVQDLIKLFTAGSVLDQPPEVHNCPISSKKSFDSTLSVASKPAIALLNIPSLSNQSSTPMRGEETMFEAALRDTESLRGILVAEDKESESTRMEFILQDWGAFEEFQKAVVRDRAHTAELVPIRPVCGFIGREGKSKLLKVSL